MIKGASVIRMMNAFLGADTFKDGLTVKLHKISFKIEI